jgi:hypothetical protein
MNSVVPLLSLFGLLYGPRLVTIDLHVVAASGLAVLGLSQIVSNWRSYWPIAALCAVTLCQFIYMLIGYSTNFPSDDTGMWLSLKEGLYILSAFAVTRLYIQRHRASAPSMFARDVAALTALNCVFVAMTVASPTFRAMAFDVLFTDGKEAWLIQGHRGLDISIGGGAIASVAFVLSLSVYLFMSDRSTEGSVRRSAVIGLHAIGIFLTSRTGTLLMLLVVCIHLVYSWNRGLKQITTLASWMGGILALGISFVVLEFMAQGQLADANDHIQSVVLPWALEFMYEGSTKSGVALAGMYFLPEFSDQVVFGISNFGRNPLCPYIPSDVGYVLLIFGCGVIGTTLILGKFYLILFAQKQTTSADRLLAIVLIGAILVTLAKEQIIGSRGIWPLLLCALMIKIPPPQKQDTNAPQ